MTEVSQELPGILARTESANSGPPIPPPYGEDPLLTERPVLPPPSVEYVQAVEDHPGIVGR